MANKKRRKKKNKRAKKTYRPPLEDRRAEVATVAWMLTMMFTFVAESVSIAIKIYLRLTPEGVELPERFKPLPNLLLIISLITGFACLALTPLVYQFRAVPPPRAITIFALVVCLAPYAMAAFILLAK